MHGADKSENGAEKNAKNSTAREEVIRTTFRPVAGRCLADKSVIIAKSAAVG